MSASGNDFILIDARKVTIPTPPELFIQKICTRKLSVGAEYNHGSEHWFSYTPAADDPSNKLATRGDVWELYLNWQFDKRIWFKLGYQHFEYDTAFSGWHIAPGPLEYFALDQNPVLFYAFPDEVDNLYAALEVRF